MLPIKKIIAAFVIIAVASTTTASAINSPKNTNVASAKRQSSIFTFEIPPIFPKTVVHKITHKKVKASAKKKLAHKTKSKASSKVFFRLTAKERDKIERVVMASCGELDDKLMAKANAQVILDRVKSGRFGKSVNAVLDAPYQFETPWKGKLNTLVKNAVSAVFDRGERVTSERIYYYENPHFSSVSTAEWSYGKHYVATIGHGYFIHEYWTDKC